MLEGLIYLMFLSFGSWILIKAALVFIDEKLQKRAKAKQKALREK